MVFVDVIATAREANAQNVGTDAAIVIDVLRATSVMVTALANGAECVIPVLTPGDALEYRKSNPGVLLGGERNAELIEGFDLGNSPLAYTRPIVEGRQLVMTTTNGTRAILNSCSAADIYIACFLNARKVAETVMKHSRISIVCSGADDLFTLEDALCAGYIINLMKHIDNEIRLSDQAISMLALYWQASGNIQAFASQGRHYKVLNDKGFFGDLDYCLGDSHIAVVPKYVDGRIVISHH